MVNFDEASDKELLGRENFIRKPTDTVDSLRSKETNQLTQSGWSHCSKEDLNKKRKAERQNKKIQRNIHRKRGEKNV